MNKRAYIFIYVAACCLLVRTHHIECSSYIRSLLSPIAGLHLMKNLVLPVGAAALGYLMMKSYMNFKVEHTHESDYDVENPETLKIQVYNDSRVTVRPSKDGQIHIRYNFGATDRTDLNDGMQFTDSFNAQTNTCTIDCYTKAPYQSPFRTFLTKIFKLTPARTMAISIEAPKACSIRIINRLSPYYTYEDRKADIDIDGRIDHLDACSNEIINKLSLYYTHKDGNPGIDIDSMIGDLKARLIEIINRLPPEERKADIDIDSMIGDLKVRLIKIINRLPLEERKAGINIASITGNLKARLIQIINRLSLYCTHKDRITGIDIASMTGNLEACSIKVINRLSPYYTREERKPDIDIDSMIGNLEVKALGEVISTTIQITHAGEDETNQELKLIGSRLAQSSVIRPDLEKCVAAHAKIFGNIHVETHGGKVTVNDFKGELRLDEDNASGIAIETNVRPHPLNRIMKFIRNGVLEILPHLGRAPYPSIENHDEKEKSARDFLAFRHQDSIKQKHAQLRDEKILRPLNLSGPGKENPQIQINHIKPRTPRLKLTDLAINRAQQEAFFGAFYWEDASHTEKTGHRRRKIIVKTFDLIKSGKKRRGDLITTGNFSVHDIAPKNRERQEAWYSSSHADGHIQRNSLIAEDLSYDL